MIRALLRLQHCTSKPGRKAFIPKARAEHGIAKGTIRLYEVTGPNWKAIRSAIADYDTTGKPTMGFSTIGPETVDAFCETPFVVTGAHIKPQGRPTQPPREA